MKLSVIFPPNILGQGQNDMFKLDAKNEVGRWSECSLVSTSKKNLMLSTSLKTLIFHHGIKTSNILLTLSMKGVKNRDGKCALLISY